MREIKFRGKDILHKEWHFGSLARDIPQNSYYIIDENYGSGVDVDENTVGQFTGLHDKNGKEIYEGDIVEIDCPTMKLTGKIKYSEMSAMFYIHDEIEDIEETLWYQKEEYEVIGNIWENPELLEDK